MGKGYAVGYLNSFVEKMILFKVTKNEIKPKHFIIKEPKLVKLIQ